MGFNAFIEKHNDKVIKYESEIPYYEEATEYLGKSSSEIIFSILKTEIDQDNQLKVSTAEVISENTSDDS